MAARTRCLARPRCRRSAPSPFGSADAPAGPEDAGDQPRCQARYQRRRAHRQRLEAAAVHHPCSDPGEEGGGACDAYNAQRRDQRPEQRHQAEHYQQEGERVHPHLIAGAQPAPGRHQKKRDAAQPGRSVSGTDRKGVLAWTHPFASCARSWARTSPTC